ncbi:Hypothetical_protein [Hexamita inflata]|uniref:Hypothetical_protein n=1 Tax=Hexamita inflata TaxID=28002 RepID=A0AA86NBX8_9EUKA|nr:Hypothetical protein HINF_LOCUS4183 [Hexamita inflata]
MTKISRSKQLVLEPLIFPPNNSYVKVSSNLRNYIITQHSVYNVDESTSLETCPKSFQIQLQSQVIILKFKIEIMSEELSELSQQIELIETTLQLSLAQLNSVCKTTKSILHSFNVRIQ